MSKRKTRNATGERVPTRMTPPFDPAHVRHRVRALVDPSGCSRIGLERVAGGCGFTTVCRATRASHDEHIVGGAGSPWEVCPGVRFAVVVPAYRGEPAPPTTHLQRPL